jgi:UDP-glucose 4-epimerase
MSTILVTGGSGFLGSHIADELTARGHLVRVFDRVPSAWRRADQQMIVGDITDAGAIAQAARGCAAVFHLAALADVNDAKSRPADTVRINVCGTLNVLEACREHSVPRLMFASTVYVYSREGGFYRCSKQACETYIEEYHRAFGLQYTILRYGSLYGLRTDSSNGIYRYLRQAIRQGELRYDGSPDDLRNYIHVTDAAVLSIDALSDTYANQHLVLTGPEAMRMQDMFRMMGEIIGRPVAVHYSSGEGPHSMQGHYGITPYAYTPKLGRKLVANPHVDIGQGLLQLVERIHAEPD